VAEQLRLFDPDEPEPRPKREGIRSDPERVHQAEEAVRQAEAERPVPSPYGTRKYHNGPNANPGWVCQGGLPSLGEGYS